MFIGNIEFARKVGSRDKKPRKKRNLKKLGAKIAGGAVGALAAGYTIRKISQKTVTQKSKPRFKSDGYLLPKSKNGGWGVEIGDRSNRGGLIASQMQLAKTRAKR